MRIRILYLALFAGLGCLSAQEAADYRHVDRHARRAPAALAGDLPRLTAYLVDGATGEAEKARAVYSWIVTNLRYDEEAYRDGRRRVNQSLADILRRRRGVCFDYALLVQAMCREAGLACEVVSGYSRAALDPPPGLAEPDHAWNALRIDGEWRLLDATWGAAQGQGAVQTDYFLMPPARFILDHLPAMPMWQLLDCPVPADVFRQAPDSIAAFTARDARCYDFQDTLRQWLALPDAERRLVEADMSWRFNPSPGNRNQLGHAWMDYAGRLADRTEQWGEDEQIDTLIRLQDSLLIACERARSLADTLYPWQHEVYINALINQSVALNQRQEIKGKAEDAPVVYRRMEHLLTQAIAVAGVLPASSLYARAARQRAATYLEIVREWLR